MTEDNTLEKRVSALEEKCLFKLLAIELNIDTLFRQMAAMTRTLQKLDVAYYEAFPDRLDKDAQFEDQLRALKSAPNPDAPPKHS